MPFNSNEKLGYQVRWRFYLIALMFTYVTIWEKSDKNPFSVFQETLRFFGQAFAVSALIGAFIYFLLHFLEFYFRYHPKKPLQGLPGPLQSDVDLGSSFTPILFPIIYIWSVIYIYYNGINPPDIIWFGYLMLFFIEWNPAYFILSKAYQLAELKQSENENQTSVRYLDGEEERQFVVHRDWLQTIALMMHNCWEPLQFSQPNEERYALFRRSTSRDIPRQLFKHIARLREKT